MPELFPATFSDFIMSYGPSIIMSILTTIATVLGFLIKKLYNKVVTDKTKESVAKTVVKAIQQLYYDLSGEEKLQKAIESATEMLAEKGITITDLELRMLIEAAVAEFKDAFNNTKQQKSNTEEFFGEPDKEQEQITE